MHRFPADLNFKTLIELIVRLRMGVGGQTDSLDAIVSDESANSIPKFMLGEIEFFYECETKNCCRQSLLIVRRHTLSTRETEDDKCYGFEILKSTERLSLPLRLICKKISL